MKNRKMHPDWAAMDSIDELVQGSMANSTAGFGIKEDFEDVIQRAIEINNEDLADMVSKALRKAWNLGQTYWQQADSEYVSQQKRSDATWAAFDKLVEEVRAEILNNG